MLTLRYFGSFEATSGGTRLPIPTRPAARLLALLASEPGRRWRREAVAAEIWPDAEYGSEGVSLRSALTMLRRTLGEGVVGADRERVWIEAGAVATDRERFGAVLRREGIETDGDRRETLLADLAEAPAGFLEGWDAPWITVLRDEHARAVARTALELARVRFDAGSYADARRLALRALGARPGNEGAIAVAARAAAALGERDEAIALAAGAGGSEELRRLAREIETAPAPTAPDRADMLFDAFETTLRTDAEGAVRFLLANRSLWWRQRDLARAKALVALALAAEGVPDRLRARAAAVASSLHLRTSHYAEALAALERAESLVGDDEPELALDIRGVRGSLLHEMRRNDEAEPLLDAAVAEYRTSEKGPLSLPVALVSRGHLLWHVGRPAEARADYAEALAALSGDHPGIGYARGTILANLAGIAHVEENWPEVERNAALARGVLTVRVDVMTTVLVESHLLLVRTALGEPGLGPRLGRAPLEAVRCGMRRMSLVVLDHVAEGFALMGHGRAARELSHAVGLFRSELGHVRSQAEERVLARVFARAEALGGSEVPPAPSTGYAELAAWTIARGDEL